MWRKLLIAAALAIFAIAPAYSQEPMKGGSISVATTGEPPTLDPMANPGDLVAMISQHIFETLLTFDENWNIVPLIAELMPDISSDGLSYTFKIRQGLTFHDGSPLDAADVVASLNRWMAMTSRGKLVKESLVSLDKVDDFTVRLTLSKPFAPLLALLAQSAAAAAIMPEEHQEAELTGYIGSGPYKLQEWAHDQYVQLVRFDGYVPREEDSNGYGGARHQYLDEIRFVPLPDSNTRVESAIAGQYDYVDSVPVEMRSRVESGADQPQLIQLSQWLLLQPNHKEGVLSDPVKRKAAQMALDFNEIMLAAFGDPQFFKLEGNLYPEGHPWYSTSGIEEYNLADPEGAKKLLATTDYNGEPVRIITSHQYEFQFRTALVMQKDLEAAGFKVDVQAMDYGTMAQNRRNPALYEFYIVNSPFPPDPGLIPALTRGSNGFWESETKRAAVDEMNAAVDPKVRLLKWDTVQGLIYKEAGFFMVGKFSDLVAVSPKLQGVKPQIVPFFWNGWLKTS